MEDRTYYAFEVFSYVPQSADVYFRLISLNFNYTSSDQLNLIFFVFSTSLVFHELTIHQYTL